MAVFRTEFAEALMKHPPSPENEILGPVDFSSPARRSFQIEQPVVQGNIFEHLLAFINDGALKADFNQISFNDERRGLAGPPGLTGVTRRKR